MTELELKGATVTYYNDFINNEKAIEYYDILLDSFDFIRRRVTYENGKAKLNRGTVAFGDDGFDIPDIWGDDIILNNWTDELREIKNMVEAITKNTYNICLCNWYSTKGRGIGWHADREELGDTQSIASISLGAKRPFLFREKDSDKECLNIELDNGSLLWMGPGTQENYEHCVPKVKYEVGGRINLTFRKFHKSNYVKKYAEN